MRKHIPIALTCSAALALAIPFAGTLSSAEPGAAGSDLAKQLQQLKGAVIAAENPWHVEPGKMLAEEVRQRLREASQRSTQDWRQLNTRADWERFRDPRIQALRDSLGKFPAAPPDLKVQVARTLEGDGYRIEDVVFESRPGLVVTANLYSPKEPSKRMPGILICPSHHNPKTQGELQDMGMNWARLGCQVLVLDNLGHGERRSHPFKDAASYDKPFRVGRQDYYFRYNTGIQLHLIGDSLIGWLAWDLMRGVDLLLSRPGIDKERIILLGSVAGGGDPAAVAAALDQRITAVAPFNFGGPQPETTFPLPENAEDAFNYSGGGSWESTRNLRLSARDGFLPWVIVGSSAPRGLIYAHEFSWDREHDPVWARFLKIFGWYEAADHLAAVKGRGKVTGKPPESTHCNNIGPEHRKGIYPPLKQWFGMASPEPEFQQRRQADELLCLTPEVEKKLPGKPLHELASALGAQRAAEAQSRLARLPVAERKKQLRADWARLLGDIEPLEAVKSSRVSADKIGELTVERIVLEIKPKLLVPLVLLLPPKKPAGVVLAVAQHGKQEFLNQRSDVLAELLEAGVAVCLPDLRGTGETRPSGDSRGRGSSATSISSTELMLGQTLLGARLRDLRTVLSYLQGRPEFTGTPLALWGDSFAPVNPADRNLQVPLDAEPLPDQAEPLGGLLALFGALYEDRVQAVFVRGGLSGYQALLQGQFLYVPHDIVVPGALTAGDLADVAAALAPRPLCLEGMVDGLDRRIGAGELAKVYEPTLAAYRAAGTQDRLRLGQGEEKSGRPAAWLLAHLKK